jgi:23S rRNA pseudouridine2605 synthase
MIKQGRVNINGVTIEDFSYLVDLNRDVISIDGKVIKSQLKPKLIIMLNKPAGVLSTTKDNRGRKTVIDILPAKYRNINLYPAGRLDMDSTGLLLLTNDGDLTYRITHPKFEHEKEYLVHVKGKLSDKEKTTIQKGVHLEDGLTYPAVLKESSVCHPYNYMIIIHEGRKRQVHRMFNSLDYRVLALKRTRIGGLKLGTLKEGQVRELSIREVERLMSNTA